MKVLTALLAWASVVAVHAQTPAAGSKPPSPVQSTSAPAFETPSADRVVLSVGDEKMTQGQYEAFIAALPDQLRAQATGPNKRKFAEQLLEMKSMAYEARRRHLDQKPEVKERMALQIDNVLASEVFRILNADLKVDPVAVKAYYDEHKSEYEEVKASHILIRFKGSTVPLRPGEKDLSEEEALAKANAVREKLIQGADFAATAKAESDDTGSGANGGSLGTFGHGRMVPVFEKAAFSQPVGQISEPLKSQFGYHLIKVEERTSKSVDDVKPQIEAKLRPELARKAVDEVKKTVPSSLDDQYFGK